MPVLPSRSWVKEHLPAFICCETSPVTSLWIRLFICCCPECRQEYHELRQVWKELDCWEVNPPSENLEDNFSQTLRTKFPAAFEDEKEAPLPRTGDLILRIAYTAAIVLLGAAVFIIQEKSSQDPLHVVAAPRGSEQAALAPKVATEKESEMLVAEAERNSKAAAGPNHSGPHPSRDDTSPLPGVQVRTTSIGNTPHSNRLPSSRNGRTIEINNFPVEGFQTLMRPDEEHSY
jgi:hypothetical protein